MKKLIVVLALTMLVLAGCGGKSDAQKRADAKATAATVEKKKEAKLAADDARRQEVCATTIKDFQDAVQAINSRLNVGLTEADFNTALGDASVAYDKIDLDTLRTDTYCVDKVGQPLQDAYNDFVKTNATWDKCNQDYNCDFKKDKLPGVQAIWTKASAKIDAAKATLDDYTPSQVAGYES